MKLNTVIKPGTVIRDEKNNRYLVVRVKTDKNSLECIDNEFDVCSIGIDFLKHYEFVEYLDMEFMSDYISLNTKGRFIIYGDENLGEGLNDTEKKTDEVELAPEYRDRLSMRNSVDVESFSNWLNRNWEKNNMLPPPINAQTALNFLHDYLIPDWYATISMGCQQVNTEMVHEILMKYSKEYRKEIKGK